jgi:glycosyltransferase involved in cell wall biosynthesis
VHLLFADGKHPWPKPWRVRTFIRRVREDLYDLRHRDESFLDGVTATVKRLPTRDHRPEQAPDADVVIATWWKTASDLKTFPARKGQKFYYVQGDEASFVASKDVDEVRATLREPMKHLCVSEFVCSVVAKYGHTDMQCVGVGVDDAFRPHPQARPQPLTLGALYNPAPLKGWQTAAEAIRIVQRKLPDLRVTTFGTHDPLPEHWVPNMTFALRPPQSKIAELAAGAHVWLLPSQSEGFGLPGIEAAASGTPVVATRCGGPADYVREGENGFLVDVGDAQGMAEALERVLTAEPAKWAAMSAESIRIAEGFRWPQAIERFEAALFRGLETRRTATAQAG